MHVFIDTNILLNFFHYSKDELDALNDVFASHEHGDVLIANLILFLPLSMFQTGQESPLYLALLWKWYPKLYHANVRSNFGILKYVLVTRNPIASITHWKAATGTRISASSSAFGIACSGHYIPTMTNIRPRELPMRLSLLYKPCRLSTC